MEKGEDVFLDAGMKQKEAKILNSFFEKESWNSRELENKLWMSQPEVSVILTNFEKKNWITYKNLPSKGKGRPVKNYTIHENKESIVDNLLKKMIDKKNSLDESIMKLENFKQSIRQ